MKNMKFYYNLYYISITQIYLIKLPNNKLSQHKQSQ